MKRSPSAQRRLIPSKVRLLVEALEDRQLLSVSPLPGVVDFSSLQSDPNSYDTTRILVRFGPEAGVSDGSVLGGATVGSALGLVPGLREVHLGKDQTVKDALAFFQADANVLYAQANFQVHIQAETTPNDPSYADLWGMKTIKAPQAWNEFGTGSLKTVVAVIDTGVDYRHPDLYLNIAINQGEIPDAKKLAIMDINTNGIIDFYDLNAPVNAAYSIDLNGNTYIDAGDLLADLSWADGQDGPDGNAVVDDLAGYDFHNNDNNPIDDHDHGTHVAGTIGAVGNNSVGVVGANWAVGILPLKFLDARGTGDTANAVRALDYAVKLGVPISNNSWGGGGSDPAMAEAIELAKGSHLFVAASGNGNLFGIAQNNDTTPHYPSGYAADNIIAVAATDSTDTFAYFSNWGKTTVDLAAPGVGILSTTRNGGYKYFDGTSMATPHVAGAAALILSQNAALSPLQVKAQILNNTDYIGDKNPGTPTVTNGRLNMYQALLNPLKVSVNDVAVNENDPAGALTFTVTLSRPATTDVTVTYSLADGTATAPGDYGYPEGYGTLVIPAGATQGVIRVPILDDALAEGNENFFLNLHTATGAVLLDGQGQATIQDNELVYSDQAMYVWDIEWAPVKVSRNQTDLRITVDVNRDANANGKAEALDTGVGGATVYLRLIHDSNGDGVYGNGKDKVYGTQANTDSLGRVTFNLQRASAGKYKAEVTNLTHATYKWSNGTNAGVGNLQAQVKENPDYYQLASNGTGSEILSAAPRVSAAAASSSLADSSRTSDSKPAPGLVEWLFSPAESGSRFTTPLTTSVFPTAGQPSIQKSATRSAEEGEEAKAGGNSMSFASSSKEVNDHIFATPGLLDLFGDLAKI